ncbi:hypothetical protein BDR22DRAFT_182024 [Usnea florida]
MINLPYRMDTASFPAQNSTAENLTALLKAPQRASNSLTENRATDRRLPRFVLCQRLFGLQHLILRGYHTWDSWSPLIFLPTLIFPRSAVW